MRKLLSANIIFGSTSLIELKNNNELCALDARSKKLVVGLKS